jgi:hypothetical protein
MQVTLSGPMAVRKVGVLIFQRAFYLSRELTGANEKTISLRPSRLCGENLNSEETDVEPKSLLRLFALPISDVLL